MVTDSSHNAVPFTAWPELTLSEWDDTRETLHRWTQVVGKLRLALEPMMNQWWQVPLYVSARGLTTSLMPYGQDLGLEVEFDFVHHLLALRTIDGRERQVELRPRSVADFYRSVTESLASLAMPVRIRPIPSELADVTPLDQDEEHRAYDPEAARHFWVALVAAHRVMRRFRAGFKGKASPVHFFWGAADLATTRFSGRPAPLHPGGVPNCPDWVQQMAYSQEVSSCGFWPGGSEEGSFYSYAYPEPSGFREWPVDAPGRFDETLGEFILPYREVRLSPDRERVILRFFQQTYEAAAQLLRWDRASLEADEPRP